MCIIGTKGKPKRVSKAVHSVVDIPIEDHSKKPLEVRTYIDDLDELYSREGIECNEKISFEEFYNIVRDFIDFDINFDEMYDFFIDNYLFDREWLIDKKKLMEDDIWDIFKVKFLRKTYQVYDFEDLEIDLT